MNHTGRTETTLSRMRILVSQSYHERKALKVTVPYKGVNTLKRDGTDTGVDRNVNTVLNAIRCAAREQGLSVNTSLTHAPSDGVCYVMFMVRKRHIRKYA